jgi:hypothetical protein
MGYRAVCDAVLGGIPIRTGSQTPLVFGDVDSHPVLSLIMATFGAPWAAHSATWLGLLHGYKARAVPSRCDVLQRVATRSGPEHRCLKVQGTV